MPRTLIASLSALAWCAVLILLPGRSLAADSDPDKTLSPYFFVESAASGQESFPLLETKVKAAISGVIANVEVRQIYKNDGRAPLHAKYVFPASTRAAVHGLTMKIGARVVVAEIREKEKAAREFAAAKRAGKTASLLEQERPNVFTMSVGNVMPGDRIEVTLQYTELLIPTEGTYEFVYPTVVGPRYSTQKKGEASAEEGWLQNPFLRAGTQAKAAFDLHVELASPIPVAKVTVPTHAVKQRWTKAGVLQLGLDGAGGANADRDFILRYRLAGDAIQSGVSLYDDGNQKFFLAVVEPPRRVVPAAIPPREFVFIVDVSGSMHGFPLDTAKTLLKNLAGQLRPQDRFNVLVFSGASSLLAPQSLPASKENVARAMQALDGMQGGGGTELLPALRRALALSPRPGLSRSFVVVTDGYISVERETFEAIRANLGRANVFAFGIGSGVNRHLIEGMARAGQGEPFIVTEPKFAAQVASRFQKYIASPVLTDVRVKFEGFDAYDVEPRAVPDVLASRPVTLFGKWRGKPSGRIIVRGVGGRGQFEQVLDVSAVKPLPQNGALPYLWARRRIGRLSDFGGGEPGAEIRSAVTKLGLDYHLLTRYTSFIAVSKEVRNVGGQGRNVKQPLPLPAGVSELAIQDELVGADEPELWLLGLVAALLALAYSRSRRAAQARRRGVGPLLARAL